MSIYWTSYTDLPTISVPRRLNLLIIFYIFIAARANVFKLYDSYTRKARWIRIIIISISKVHGPASADVTP